MKKTFEEPCMECVKIEAEIITADGDVVDPEMGSTSDPF